MLLIFHNIHRKHLCLRPAIFIKKETLTQLFSCEFCEIFKNTFFTEHLWTTASLTRGIFVQHHYRSIFLSLINCNFMTFGKTFFAQLIRKPPFLKPSDVQAVDTRLSTSWEQEYYRYSKADLKICQYLPLHTKMICWRFRIKTRFTLRDMCTEIYEKFVYKYSETIKYVKQPTFYKIFRVLFLYEHKRIARYSNITLSFLYKQTVYKQLALGWQIAQQLSGLIPLSLSNNKKYG